MSQDTSASRSSPIVDWVPNEGDRAIVSIRGSEPFGDLSGAIVRYYPGEDDGDEAVRARKRAMVQARAAIVRVMPRPPKGLLPAMPAVGKRASLREVVLEAARAKNLEGLELAVSAVMAEVGL